MRLLERLKIVQLQQTQLQKSLKRFTEKDWKQDGEYIEISYTLKDVDKDSYIRLRGTNTDQLEPETDPRGEDPWTDLWFYSNPVFIKTAK